MMDKQELQTLIGQKCENLFQAGGLCCSEAIIVCMARGFCDDLPAELAASLGAGLCGGMGGGEGACGALSGAEVALGVVLGPGRPGGLSKKKMRLAAKQLHDAFKQRFFSTVCADLTKEYKKDRKAQKKNCGAITAEAARITAAVLLDWAPALLERADIGYLQGRDSKLSTLLKKIRG